MNSRLKNLSLVEKPVEILRGKAAAEWLKNTPYIYSEGIYRGFSTRGQRRLKLKNDLWVFQPDSPDASNGGAT